MGNVKYLGASVNAWSSPRTDGAGQQMETRGTPISCTTPGLQSRCGIPAAGGAVQRTPANEKNGVAKPVDMDYSSSDDEDDVVR